jgi:hypothetical protein
MIYKVSLTHTVPQQLRGEQCEVGFAHPVFPQLCGVVINKEELRAGLGWEGLRGWRRRRCLTLSFMRVGWGSSQKEAGS